MKIVELHATIEMTKKYHPQTWNYLPVAGLDRRRANFPVDPAACKDPLGKWLAEHITSNIAGDPRSICEVAQLGVALEMPRQLYMMIEENRWARANATQIDDFFDSVMDWVRRSKLKAKNSQTGTLGPYSIFFEWPDFGSESTDYADTVESYFDQCAHQIHATGGVVLVAGSKGEYPPESLLKDMADGAGPHVLSNYTDYCGMPTAIEMNLVRR
jgi:hypothetical protein